MTFWYAGGLAAFLVGFSKTGMPGLGIVIVPLMVMIFLAKQSVGALLIMMMVGDLFALGWYRHHADWSRLWGLFPGIIAGMIVGGVILARITDTQMKPLLGWLILALVLLQIYSVRFGWSEVPKHWLFVSVLGILAGFATTIGNVAGPIMSIYLLAIGFSKEKFIGTGAWYYVIVNAMKVPLFYGLGMITVETLRFNAVAVPAIVIGAVVGKLTLPRIPRVLFDRAVLILAAVAAVRLLVG